MGDNQRALVLERGEVMFGVAHDSQRPFRVEAGNGTVTALGTRLQIRREPAQVTVTLLAGSVALERLDRGERRQLKQCDQDPYGAAGTPVAVRVVDTAVGRSLTSGGRLIT